MNIKPSRVFLGLCCAGILLSGCTMKDLKVAGKPSSAFDAMPPTQTASVEPSTVVPMGYAATSMAPLISKYAAEYQVPESLIHRVVKKESGYNAGARNGPYYGLMQIRHDTATTMGYSGPASGLLDAETNLRYAVKYLRGAYLVAGGNEAQAMRFYSSGYYYDAKRKGILEETGLR